MIKSQIRMLMFNSSCGFFFYCIFLLVFFLVGYIASSVQLITSFLPEKKKKKKTETRNVSALDKGGFLTISKGMFI